MKILVTGGTGFIGNKLVSALSNLDENITLLSRKPHPKINTVICDLYLNEIPNEIFKDIDAVFHLAAFTHNLNESNEFDKFYKAINVDATINLAQLALKNNVKKFIYVSSVKAEKYELFSSKSVNKSQKYPRNIYGKTKREAEKKILEIAKNTSMQVSIIRPALVYGPNAKGNLHSIITGIQQGWFPPLPEVRNQRSMIHVDDLVRAMILIYQKEKIFGEIYNATDGVLYSSRDIYEAICKSFNKKVPKWSVPIFIFNFISFFSPRIRTKFDKIFGDEYYSSEKLESIGFKAKKTLENLNETSF
jgi:nucleoside-diphosphate-sugar epimerase